MIIIPWLLIVPIALTIIVLVLAQIWHGRLVLGMSLLGLAGLIYSWGVMSFNFPLPKGASTRVVDILELACLLMLIMGIVVYGYVKTNRQK